MKPVLPTLLALALAAPALAQPAGDMNAMPGMSRTAGAGQAPMTMADGVGVVTAVDPRGGTATIHHGPISGLNWPAMTMTFKATSPSVLEGVKVGQSVRFQLMKMGDVIQLTSIHPR